MTIEEKALALVNEIERERGDGELTPRIMRGLIIDEALCRAIEQHEAFRQEVSDVASVCAQHFCENSWTVGDRQDHIDMLTQFIIPKPNPDPLVDVLLEMDLSSDLEEGQHDAKWLRIKLDALGFEIREKGH